MMSTRIFEGSALATNYALYRPSVPEVVTAAVIKHTKDTNDDPLHELVVDVGCGSGQFTQSLAKHFDRALGFDVSEGQIEEANRQNRLSNVEYSISPAESLPLQDGSVDLLTASSAVHWFDLPAFIQETYRVLKPGGCVAIIGTYRKKSIDHENELITSKLIKCNETFMQELCKYKIVDQQKFSNSYESLEFPSCATSRFTIKYPRTLTAAAYVNMIQTSSFCIKYSQLHPGTTIFKEFEDSLQSILVSEGELKDPAFQLTWNYDILMACKPKPTL